jgi:hypothetical protein
MHQSAALQLSAGGLVRLWSGGSICVSYQYWWAKTQTLSKSKIILIGCDKEAPNGKIERIIDVKKTGLAKGAPPHRQIGKSKLTPPSKTASSSRWSALEFFECGGAFVRLR